MDETHDITHSGSHDAPVVTAAHDAYDPVEQQALKLLREFFPGAAHIEDWVDPEHPDERWRLIVVADGGDAKDVVARTVRWHYRIAEVLGHHPC
jgi:hypothetical protein